MVVSSLQVSKNSVAGGHQQIAKRAPSILKTKPGIERNRFCCKLLNSVSKNHQKSVSRKRHDPRKQSLGKRKLGSVVGFVACDGTDDASSSATEVVDGDASNLFQRWHVHGERQVQRNFVKMIESTGGWLLTRTSPRSMVEWSSGTWLFFFFWTMSCRYIHHGQPNSELTLVRTRHRHHGMLLE